MKKNQLFLILIALLAFGQTVWAQNYYTDCSWDAENPMEGKDYAVVNAEPIGEMPVSFKAEENGSYTIGIDGSTGLPRRFAPRNDNFEAGFAYLHLIDNLTGNDIDLLATPNYTFEAKTTDYANRFKLVFSTNNEDDNYIFAYISNGQIVIDGVDGSVLEIVDVTGRVILRRDAKSCVSTAGMVPGVYVLRLINGNDVKTQKIVIK